MFSHYLRLLSSSTSVSVNLGATALRGATRVLKLFAVIIRKGGKGVAWGGIQNYSKMLKKIKNQPKILKFAKVFK